MTYLELIEELCRRAEEDPTILYKEVHIDCGWSFDTRLCNSVEVTTENNELYVSFQEE